MDEQFTLSEKDFQEEKRKKVLKPLLWFGMASIVMLFAGLTSAVIVRKGDGEWLSYELPSVFLVSTIIVVLSSLFLVLANVNGKANKIKQMTAMLWLALVAGISFGVTQFIGYAGLVENSVFFTGPTSNASGSFFYIISLLHLLHMIGGMIALLVVIFNAWKGRYNKENLLGLQVCSIYWHFMGGMWIYLYVFFNTII